MSLSISFYIKKSKVLSVSPFINNQEPTLKHLLLDRKYDYSIWPHTSTMNTVLLSMLYLLIYGSSSTIQTGNFGFGPADEVGLQFFPHFIDLQAKTFRLTKLFSGSISQEM